MAELSQNFDIARIRDIGTSGGPEALVDLLIEAGKVKLEEAQEATKEVLTYFKQEGEEVLFDHRGFWTDYFKPAEEAPASEASKPEEAASPIAAFFSEIMGKFDFVEGLIDTILNAKSSIGGQFSGVLGFFQNIAQSIKGFMPSIGSNIRSFAASFGVGASQTQDSTETDAQEEEPETEIADTDPADELDPEKEATLAAALASQKARGQFADNAPGPETPVETLNPQALEPAPGVKG